jgi:hypothetical protein
VSQNARRYEAGKKDLEKLEEILSNVNGLLPKWVELCGMKR